MKKLFAVMMAAATIAMVGCKKDDSSSPAPKSDVPEVEATEGAYTIVWHAVDFGCDSKIILCGNHNGFATDVTTAIYFEELEGYDNWFKAVIPDFGGDHFEGKPVVLTLDDEFPDGWKFQWGATEEHPIEALRGAEIKPDDYPDQYKLYIYELGTVGYVESYGFLNGVDPCVPEVLRTVVFNLTTEEEIPAEDVINIIGGFPGRNWTDEGVEFLAMERVDNKHFTLTVQCYLNTEYKYAANAAAHVEAGESAWKNEMYLVAPEEGDTCVAQSKDNLKVADVEIDDMVAGFVLLTTGAEIKGFCKEAKPEGDGWFIKHPWGTGESADWSWQQMSEENGVFVYTGLWGGVGANINTIASDAGADWHAAADIPGAEGLEIGQEVTFVYNPETDVLSIQAPQAPEDEPAEEGGEEA